MVRHGASPAIRPFEMGISKTVRDRAQASSHEHCVTMP
jgi:hypothetical protein